VIDLWSAIDIPTFRHVLMFATEVENNNNEKHSNQTVRLLAGIQGGRMASTILDIISSPRHGDRSGTHASHSLIWEVVELPTRLARLGDMRQGGKFLIPYHMSVYNRGSAKRTCLAATSQRLNYCPILLTMPNSIGTKSMHGCCPALK
jgi:hypothetical protein